MNRDALCLLGIGCFLASCYLSPAIGLAACGVALIVIGVRQQRSEDKP